MAFPGKISRLAEPVQEALNERLRVAGSGAEILAWLNGLPETQAMLAQHFGGAPVSAQNLSFWRRSHYVDWEQRRDRNLQRVDRTRELAQVAMQLAQAGGSTLADGAAALLGGSILEVFAGVEDLKELLARARAGQPQLGTDETQMGIGADAEGSRRNDGVEGTRASEGANPPPDVGGYGRSRVRTNAATNAVPNSATNSAANAGPQLDAKQVTELVRAVGEAIGGLTLSVSRLRRGDQGREAIRQNEVKLRQRDEALQFSREKFQRATAEAVLKSAQDVAVQQIAAAPLDYSAQLEAVGRHLFGDLWRPPE